MKLLSHGVIKKQNPWRPSELVSTSAFLSPAVLSIVVCVFFFLYLVNSSCYWDLLTRVYSLWSFSVMEICALNDLNSHVTSTAFAFMWGVWGFTLHVHMRTSSTYTESCRSPMEWAIHICHTLCPQFHYSTPSTPPVSHLKFTLSGLVIAFKITFWDTLCWTRGEQHRNRFCYALIMCHQRQTLMSAMQM